MGDPQVAGARTQVRCCAGGDGGAPAGRMFAGPQRQSWISIGRRRVAFSGTGQEVLLEASSLPLFSMVLQAGGGAGGAIMWLPLIFIFVIFYFLLIMPQQRRQKKWQAMLSNLKTGDRVVTSGGLRGSIIALRDD